MPHQPTLILAAGGIRSLVATAAVLSATDKAEVVLMHLREESSPAAAAGAATGGRLALARRQAEHFRLRQFIELDLPRPHPAEGTPVQQAAARAPLARPQVLLTAIAQAIQLRARRVVWPVQVNADFDAVARLTEQTVLVQHCAALEHAELPAIETPLLELTDRQVIELGAHLAVPWHLAWSCLLQGDKPCRVCAGCRRRRAAFDAARMPDAVDGPAGNAKVARPTR